MGDDVGQPTMDPLAMQSLFQQHPPPQQPHTQMVIVYPPPPQSQLTPATAIIPQQYLSFHPPPTTTFTPPISHFTQFPQQPLQFTSTFHDNKPLLVGKRKISEKQLQDALNELDPRIKRARGHRNTITSSLGMPSQVKSETQNTDDGSEMLNFESTKFDFALPTMDATSADFNDLARLFASGTGGSFSSGHSASSIPNLHNADNLFGSSTPVDMEQLFSTADQGEKVLLGSVEERKPSKGRKSAVKLEVGDDFTDRKGKRRRSAEISELRFKEIYKPEEPPYDCIRVWVNNRNMVFYDCKCNQRKPVQDLNKIKRHAERHQIQSYRCDICNKEFDRYLQLNAHKKAHRKHDPDASGKE
jgi:hypothetical protein